MHPRTLSPLLALLTLVAPACDTVSEKAGRFEQGTRPDAPLPTVPAPPRESGESPVGAKVIVLACPGLDAGDVERGMEAGYLPNLRHLRTEATLVRAALSDPPTGPSAGARFLLGADPTARGITAEDDVGFRVEDALLKDLFPHGAPEAYPATLAVIGSKLARPTLIERLEEMKLRTLVLRWPIGFPEYGGERTRALGSGALPDLSMRRFGAAQWTFAIEDPSAEERATTPHGGVVLHVAPTTRDRSEDTFLVPIAGPKRFDSDERATCTLDVRASKDRARARVSTGDTTLDVAAGRWSLPLTMRFKVASGVSVFGRARVYLRPTGAPQLSLYVEPPEFAPAQPLAWLPLSTPPELAPEIERRNGPLPRVDDEFPYGALADGLLDGRDIAAALEAEFVDERRLFENECVRGDWELLLHWIPVAEHAVRIGKGDAAAAKQEVTYLGRRVVREKLVESALASLDRLIGAAIIAVDSGELGPDAKLIVWSPYGLTEVRGAIAGSPGIFATTRVATGARERPSAEDVAATVLSMLHVAQPGTMTGTAMPAGRPMPPLPTTETSVTPAGNR